MRAVLGFLCLAAAATADVLEECLESNEDSGLSLRQLRAQRKMAPVKAYSATPGYCRGGAPWPTGSVWDCSPGVTNGEGCRAACDETPGCAAFDQPAPASAAGECCLFKAGNVGNGAPGRSCMVKAKAAPTEVDAAYGTTMGYCRGGPAWPSGSVWDCSTGETDEAGCQAACDARSGCGAFDLPEPLRGRGECCLFKAGSVGNGASERSCRVKKRPAPVPPPVSPSTPPAAANAATCAGLEAPENRACSAGVSWAFSRGLVEHPEWYYVGLQAVSRVTAPQASLGDLQRLSYCGKIDGSPKCGLPPCTCSVPPCDICEHSVSVPKLEKPFVRVKKFNLAQDPKKEFDVVAVPDAELTHSCSNYTDDGTTVLTRDGQLVLRVSSACRGGICLNAGRVMSKESFTYGIFTWSARVPKCHSVWPALWLLPQSTGGDGAYGPWPCSGEIDVLETVHGDAFGAFNLVAGYGSTGGSKGYCGAPAEISTCNMCAPPAYCTSTTLADAEASHYHVEDVNCAAGQNSWDEHTFVLFWQPDVLATFVDPQLSYNSDGNLIGLEPKVHPQVAGKPQRVSYKVYERSTTPTWKAVETYMQKCFHGQHAADAPFDKGMKIVMNIAVGGYGGAPCSWGSTACAGACGGAVGAEMVVSDISVWEQT